MVGLAAAALPLSTVIASGQISSCSGNPKEAVAEARRAIATRTPDDDRQALMCLTEAVSALDAKVDALAAEKAHRIIVPSVSTKEGR
jgi:hypothetical protein